ncbi:MAG: cold shock domain-containing protein [bacterium]|nr:cold shock domain-containing protein [bacterium]
MAEQGSVKWYSLVKGYGFIRRDGDGEEIFVHYTAVTDVGSPVLEEGERVSFEVVEGPKGLKARNVTRR